MTTKPAPIVVLIGGNGSNLQALIDHPSHRHVYQIQGVISHRFDAYGIERAKAANINYQIVPHSAYSERAAFEEALITAINSYQPSLIVLAGFMRILSGTFIQYFAGKIVNIHPSLLPNYKGLNTHQRVLAAGEKEHGISIHFVTEECDGGPLIAQVRLPVLPEDDEASLAKRIHTAEHWLYPQIVGWYAQNRLKYHDNSVTLDNNPVGPFGLQLTLPIAQGILL